MDADFKHQSVPSCPFFDPMDPVHLADPYPVYAALRRDTPVFYDPQLDVWVVSRYADILAAVKQPEIFSSSGALSASGEFSPPVQAVLAAGVVSLAPILTETDGAVHARIRTAFNRAFTRKLISGMEPRIRVIAGELIDEFAADGKADLASQFAGPLSGLVMCELLGIPRVDLPMLKTWNNDWGTLLSANVPEEEQIRCAHSVLAHQQYLYEQLLDRQVNPREDILTAILPAELGGNATLSLGEAIYNVIDSLVSVNEPTEKMILNAVAALFAHREQRDKLQADPALLEEAVEEILRYATPVQGLFRVTTCPVEVSGVTIPANSRVFLLYASANHDEERFENPEVLDLDRPLARDHMTFARGMHACMGAPLVRIEVRLALELLQKRLPTLRPASDAAPRRNRHLWVTGYDSLPVEWDPIDTGAMASR